MENEIKKENNLSLPVSGAIVVILILGLSGYTIWLSKNKTSENLSHPARLSPENIALISAGVELPVKWGNLGVQMVETGVIDKEKFENLYRERGGLSLADQKLLSESSQENLVITKENSGVLLNMLWALGLGNKNPILESGPMVDKKYGGAGNFASTGGWTLSRGNAMDHYSMHSFITLTGEQQELVARVSKNIYRPCCGNSTHFPDCNHGMAMLGLLQLMASQGVSEADMYKVALQVNTLWFPDTYEAIKTFFVSQNRDWSTVDPKEILGAEYSSSLGYQNMLSKMEPQEQKGGTGCGA